MSQEHLSLRRRIYWLTWIVIAGLLVSGATAIPLRQEIDRLVAMFKPNPRSNSGAMSAWLLKVQQAIEETHQRYPFLAYGTDWLAFGHFVIAVAFFGALRHPVRNRWLFDFGLIACAMVIPYALIFGAVRGIPLWWRLIDCSFGVLGAIPLYLCRIYALRLEVRTSSGAPVQKRQKNDIEVINW